MKATIKLEDGTEVSITLTQDQIDSITPKGRWKPDIWQDYYSFFNADIKKYTFSNLQSDRTIVALGNCYQTEKLAYKAATKQIAIVRVNDRIDELNNGWVADWKDNTVLIYHICYHDSSDRYSICSNTFTKNCLILSYIATEEIANTIIKEKKSDLDLIFNV